MTGTRHSFNSILDRILFIYLTVCSNARQAHVHVVLQCYGFDINIVFGLVNVNVLSPLHCFNNIQNLFLHHDYDVSGVSET